MSPGVLFFLIVIGIVVLIVIFIAVILLLSSKKEKPVPTTKNCTTGECTEMLNEIKRLETLITSIKPQVYLPTYPRERLPEPREEIRIVTQEPIPQNYARKEIPQEYTQEPIPQNYARKEIPQEYTQEPIPQNYARKEIPQEYTREITQEESIPQNYARKDTKNYPEPTSETEKTQTYSAECKDNLPEEQDYYTQFTRKKQPSVEKRPEIKPHKRKVKGWAL
jgi:hypothetical protein